MLSKVFCKICGVFLANQFNALSEKEVDALPEGPRRMYEGQHLNMGVNVRALHGVDVDKLKTKKVDGRNLFTGDYANP